MAVAEVAVTDLRDALARGAKLIDVREPNEYEASHIAGAVLVPMQSVPDHLDVFREAQPTYVMCRSGGRSHRVCEFLEQEGIEAINVAGGILAWAELGEPVEVGFSGQGPR